MSIIDSAARETALDPKRSFCVTAPAGSGKTELLIQRYLALLARVEKPEQVLAITFTRKAAAEMRERILQALGDAIDGSPCGSSHQETTRALAIAALDADNARAWNLVRNSSQLNIKTIDSFCGALTRQMPVLSQFGGQASVTDFAEDLYIEAVQELFSLLSEEGGISDDLKSLMSHFDNDWSRLQDLLVSMLGRREQWSTSLGVHHEPDEAEQYLLEMVTALVDEALADLAQKVMPYSSELLELKNFSAKHLDEAILNEFPTPTSVDLSAWNGFRNLLLTADKAGKWRAQINVRMGFPTGKGENEEYKKRLKTLISELVEIDGLLESLVAVSSLPKITANSESWTMVVHLSRILPMLSAQLLLVFQRHGRVDHTQVALSALDALGTDESPTELALRMDYQLQHLLLDEFQDTAINQYQLVTRLTRGWGDYNHANPDNPRSIMVVGDGMQSIYGFRNANVGLFLQAKADGFNGVLLEHLDLRSNFRSEAGIVNWVNDCFSQAFPAQDNITRSQISYTAASAVKPLLRDPAVTLHSFRGDYAAQQETDFICQEVQRGVDDPHCKSIAILARTRPHLQGILTTLKTLGVAYSAQDIDSLASSHVIVDLMSICRALYNPADSVAWMALMRAPWCGLTLADLHQLRNRSGGLSPWQIFSDAGILATVSEDGRQRLLHLGHALLEANKNRDRLALRVWIEQLWLTLAGPASLESPAQLDDAERFFTLLEQAELEGEGLNLAWLESHLQRLYVKAESPDSKVEVMTLHKAKGLEFDWVIIPSTQKTTRSNTRPLLNWDEHTGASGHRGFLLAANDHSAPDEPNLYNYLEIQRAKKELEETTRLLYVGATRAASRLILTASLKYKEEKEQYTAPPARSLLGRIWSIVEQQVQQHEPVLITEDSISPHLGNLRRIKNIEPRDMKGSDTQASSDSMGDSNIPSRSVNRVERAVGTVVHLILEELSVEASLPAETRQSTLACCDCAHWSFELRRLGLSGKELLAAELMVRESIDTVLKDEQGRWLLSTAHSNASSELALNSVDLTGKSAKLIIDRTFVDAETGIRWLVDYKNSRPSGGESLQHFLQREEETYAAQLGKYKNVLQAMGAEPIQCALYFTTIGNLHLVGAP
jgi:ATP-dependent helicase/nuclease subunit A